MSTFIKIYSVALKMKDIDRYVDMIFPAHVHLMYFAQTMHKK
jgi:hypothetical protein